MYPVLFSLGRRTISTYSVVMGLFLLLALIWLAREDHRHRDGRLNAALIALFAGLVGARVIHVFSNWIYFKQRPDEVFSFASGGLSLHGGLLIGITGLALGAWWKYRTEGDVIGRIWQLASALMGPFALVYLGGWLACLLAGCAYGRAVAPPQRVYSLDWPDIYGVVAFRWPSQLMGVVLAFALLAIALRWPDRPGLFLVILGLGDFFIAFTRGDLAVSWGPLLATQWADLVIVATGLMLTIYRRRLATSPVFGTTSTTHC
ncbi:MAG: prolipoprotein diacylglyceryl transferase family protein [Chloroflexota bacterium]|nr:prolipoprotein diacylglyceryl transferase family protein [Chloroflexota bacterium]